MTTYNRKKFIKKAIKSVIKQTFKDWELIIVDDASTDGTKKIIKKFEDKDSRIRSITRKENYGTHTRPKNDGTKAAKAALIAYLDDDNEYYEDHLQALYNEMKRNPFIDGVYGDRDIFEDGKKKGVGIASEWEPATLVQMNFIDTSDVLIKKKAIEHVGGWDESLPKWADWNLFLRLAKANIELKRVPTIITRYNLHDGSMQLKDKTTMESNVFDPVNCNIWPAKTLYGKEPKTKIAIFTLTKDRFDYTKKTIDSLKKNAGHDYDHYIVDNGSNKENLKKLEKYLESYGNLYTLVKNKKNKGISIGSNQALGEIMKNKYDLIIKLDNDCEVLTPDILKRIAKFYSVNRQVVCSPYVQGLVDNVGGARRVKIGEVEYHTVNDETVGMVEHVGGIFCVAPSFMYKKFRWNEKDFMHGMQDLDFSSYCLRNGMGLCYLEDLKVEHIDTTEGQKKKNKEYFKKREEEKVTRGK